MKGQILMSTWRRLGFSGAVLGAMVLAITLPGCSGGETGQSSGPNPEVEIVPPKDEHGNPYPVGDDPPSSAPAK